VTVCEKVVTVE